MLLDEVLGQLKSTPVQVFELSSDSYFQTVG